MNDKELMSAAESIINGNKISQDLSDADKAAVYKLVKELSANGNQESNTKEKA